MSIIRPKNSIFSFHLRLFPRFLILLLALAVIPVALVGRIIVKINDESLQFEVQRYHLKLAQSLSEKFDERLHSLVSQLNIGISAIKNPETTWEERQKLLSALIDSSPHFGIIAAVSHEGQELIKAYNPTIAPEVDKNPSLLKHSNFALYQAFRKSERQEVQVTKTESLTYAEVYVPFDTPTGKNAVYVKLSLNDLCEMIAKESIGLTGFATYVWKNGEIVSKDRNLPNGEPIPLNQSMIQTALNGSLGSHEFTDSKNQSWIMASAPVSKLGGAILTQQTIKEAYRYSSKGKQRALIFVFITIILAIFVAGFLARSLTSPLIAITKVAKEVDLINGHFPELIEIKSKDEIEDLNRTFNEMLKKLKGYAEIQVEKVIIEQKKTEAIIFSIRDGIIMTDYQGRVQLINENAKNILNIGQKDSILGEQLWKFLPSPELKTACVDLLTKPENQKSIEVKLTNQESKESYYDLSSSQVQTPGKKETLGMVTVFHDITLEKEIDSMKEEFLHSITHDLRNPLTAIRGFIRLFQSGQTGSLTEIQQKMFETMDKASLRLMNMINDILDLARLESNRLLLHIEESHIEDISNRVIELFSPQTKSSNIKLKIQLDTTVPSISIDPNLIERVFTNLIGNAIKFTPDGGAITVKIRDEGNQMRCAVVDTGEGIPENYLLTVFDKFKQVEGHFKGGAGLGLTICKKIIEAHYGKIWVESEMGVGSSFIFILPKNINKKMEEQKAA
ncbi:MAG: ATP-binding protein [Elusimicrobiota bacterium]